MEEFGWNKSSLGELGKITSSKRIFKNEYVKEGVPFYRTKEVKELANGNEIATELFIKKERFDEIVDKFGSPKKGDILLTAIGTIGEIYVVKGSEPFYFKDGNVLWLKDFNSLDEHFLRYALMAFVDELKLLSRGAAYNALPINKLKNYEIFVPPIPEQKRIVATLDQAFADIQQARAKTEQNLKNARELFESSLQQVFSQRGEGWEEYLLGDVCTFKHGFAFKSEFFTQDKGYVLLTPGNFFEEGGYRDRGEKQKYYDGTFPNEFLLSKGALLVAMTEQAVGLLGSPALVPKDSTFLHNQRLGLVELTDEFRNNLSMEFLFHLFNTKYFRSKVQETATGLKVRHTSPKKMQVIPIWLPSDLNEQKKIALKLFNLKEESLKLEEIYKAKALQLDELKKSILQKAFSGELTKALEVDKNKGVVA